jgi:hypothetical protein
MRPPTLKSSRDRAWKAMSQYVLARDKKCVTCPSGKAENAGHYWHNVLDFDEENINAQCFRCNHFLSGNLAPYGSYLLKKLGVKRFKALDIRHTQAIKGEKRTIEEYLELEALYKSKLAKLEG